MRSNCAQSSLAATHNSSTLKSIFKPGLQNSETESLATGAPNNGDSHISSCTQAISKSDTKSDMVDGDDSHFSSGIQPHLQIHHKIMTQFLTKPETAQNVGIITEEEENLLYYNTGKRKGHLHPKTAPSMALDCALRSPQPLSKLIPTKNDPISTKTETASQCSYRHRGKRKFIMHHRKHKNV